MLTAADLITAALLDVAWILTGRAAVRRLTRMYGRKVAWRAGGAWAALIAVASAAADQFSGPHISHPIAGEMKAIVATAVTAVLLNRWLDPMCPGLFTGGERYPLPPRIDIPAPAPDRRSIAPEGDRHV